MVEKKYIIHHNQTLLEALKQINDLREGPLVLFAIDEDERMVGSITDGDSRRAFIAGATVESLVKDVIHTSFNFIRKGEGNLVQELKRQKDLHMKLVPILDERNRIVDIINLEKNKTQLPVDAVLMAGGKGERLRPLTEKIPKPLLPVGGKAIIDHNIDRLISYGVQHISVTVNYLKEQLEDHYALPHNGIKVQIVQEVWFLYYLYLNTIMW